MNQRGPDIIPTQERYRLGSLGELIELLLDGWRIEHLHYAESCGRDGAAAPPAAFVELSRPDQGRYGIFIPDDGRALTHRALVSLFRERPHIWKHRSADRIHAMAGDLPMAMPRESTEWGEVPQPFPQALVFSPGTLRGVVPINQTQSVGGVTISLTVLERYQQGARLRFLAHAVDAKRKKHLATPHDVAVVDESGRPYRVAPLEIRREGGRAEGVLVLAPAIPKDVSAITVTIGSLGDARAPGPWVFPIQIADRIPAEV
jgi:hypothetical protein